MIVELIRHGETALQAEKRYQGSTDAPLSPEGKDKLLPSEHMPERLFVTRLCRTRQTAELLFPGLEQTIAPGLEEIDFGAFEGRSFLDMEQDADYRAWVESQCEAQCPGGESKAEFCARVCAAFASLLDQAESEGVSSLAVVAHGGTLMAILERFCTERKSYFDWHTDSGKGVFLQCERQAGEWKLRLLGTTDHTRR